MTGQTDYVELTRIGDPVQADLFTAFLEDGDIEFQVVNRSGAGFMNQLIPRAANPVVFRVLAQDIERGRVLLEEYRTLQMAISDGESEGITDGEVNDSLNKSEDDVVGSEDDVVDAEE